MGGGSRVNVVDANAGAPDHAQLRRKFQELCGDLHGGADDKCFGICQFGFQAILDLIGGDHLP